MHDWLKKTSGLAGKVIHSAVLKLLSRHPVLHDATESFGHSTSSMQSVKQAWEAKRLRNGQIEANWTLMIFPGIPMLTRAQKIQKRNLYRI